GGRRGTLMVLVREGRAPGDVELGLGPVVRGRERLGDPLEGLLQRGRGVDVQRDGPLGPAAVGAARAAGGQQRHPRRGRGEPGRGPHAPPPARSGSGSASTTTCVALTTALATLPGFRPCSCGASLLI